MRSSLWLGIVLLATVAPSCSSRDGDAGGGPDGDAGVDADAPAQPKAFGDPCQSDNECADGACSEGTCTRACADYSGCPGGTVCGAGDDGRLLCVVIAYDAENVGKNCTNHDEVCGPDTRCRSRGRDDPLAFCANDCETDRDCPPQWYCNVGPDSPETKYCQKRSFCDPCNVDDDCRYGDDDCIVGADGNKFCSYVCDPDPGSSSCPVDAECREVRGHGFQCVPVVGGCTGDGSLCQPCRLDSDCTYGPCLYDRYAMIRFCGQDCAEDGICPPEFDCLNLPDNGSQCYPRRASCSRPSGGGHTCDICRDRADCATGECITFQTGQYCGDDCADSDCGPWAECQSFQDGAGGNYRLCVPEGTLSCGHYYQCTQNCEPEDVCDRGSCE